MGGRCEVYVITRRRDVLTLQTDQPGKMAYATRRDTS